MNRPLLMLLLLPILIAPSCQEMDGIAFIGNSVTRADSAHITTPWPSIVAWYKAPRRIHNLGCNSATSATWLVRAGEPHLGLPCPQANGEGGPSPYDHMLLPSRDGLRWVFVLLGTGDAFFTGSCLSGWTPCDDTPISPAQFRANIELLVDRIWQDVPWLFGIVLVKPWSGNNFLDVNTTLSLYHTQLDAICQADPRTRCGPSLEGVLLPEHYDVDALHPNDAGNAAIAAEILQWITTWGL